MEYPLERKGFRYGPGWKKWSVFFMDKKESQLQWIPILFVRSSLWKFQSVMFQQIDFRSSCVFSHPGETRREKNWRSSKKFNYWPLSSENLTDLWFQLSRKIENTQPRWQPTYVINKSKTTLQTWTLRVMCSFRKKTTTAQFNLSFLTENINDW